MMKPVGREGLAPGVPSRAAMAGFHAIARAGGRRVPVAAQGDFLGSLLGIQAVSIPFRARSGHIPGHCASGAGAVSRSGSCTRSLPG
jgi:hypothetical protein